MTSGTYRWVLLAAVTGTLAAGAGPNLLNNPGFEEGLAGWTPDPKHELVEGAAKAASGTKCVSGEATGPKQALRLVQNVPVRAGRAYHFNLAARGTKDTKITLFGQFPGEPARRSLAVWEPVGPRWNRYEAAPFAAKQDGALRLEIIAPSSHAAPVGRVWVDDAVLTETIPPARIDVSGTTGFNDEPALAMAADGSLYASWISFRDGADTLRVARFTGAGSVWSNAGAWQVAGGKGTWVLGPRLVASGAGATLVYASEAKGGDWGIVAVPVDASGPGRPVTVCGDAGADIDPAVAWHDGTLWVAWEGSRAGRRRILAASVRDGRAGPAEVLSAADVSACDPSIAVTAAGEVHVAWHDFRAGRVDVYLRSRPAQGGAWRPERRITRAPAIDRHPVLVARGDDLWMLYETAQVREYHVGASSDRTVRLLRVTADEVFEPAAGCGPLAEGAEGAGAAFDAQGRLWVAFLRPPSKQKAPGWNAMLTAFAGGAWMPAVAVSAGKGLDRAPGVAVPGGTPLVLHQVDDMPHSWTNEAVADLSSSEIRLAAVVPADLPAFEVAKWTAPEEPEAPFAPADLRADRGEDLAPPPIEYKGRTLRLFFGDLHEHTDVSPCGRIRDQTIDESYQHMRDLAVHDFACVTDHGYGLNSHLWNTTAKLARVNEDPGRFLTFLGEEWTSTFEEYSEKHPYGFYGHRNLVLADSYFPRWWNAKNRQTPAQLWEDLRKLNANFVNIPHQIADTGNVPTDWDYVDEVAQPVAEIFQTRGSYEHKGTPREARNTTPKGWFLQDAWARGIVIGVIASPDHGGGYGKACVYAESLTREAILDALRARRCYGTTAARIALDVRVAGRLMGEKSADPAPASVPVEVRVTAPNDLDRVEVCRNNVFVYSKACEGRTCSFTFTDREPPKDRAWYYVRVVQKDGELAWSSPVWFGAK